MEETLAQALERACADINRTALGLGAEAAAVLLNADNRIEIVHFWSRAGQEPEQPGRVWSASMLVHRWTANPKAVQVTFDFPDRNSVPRMPEATAEVLNRSVLAFWSAFEIGKLRAELRAVNARLATRKIVERAKGVLQNERGISEDTAYAWLRRQSRSRRITLARVAAEVVRIHARPDGSPYTSTALEADGTPDVL
jgi:hypothetical protein